MISFIIPARNASSYIEDTLSVFDGLTASEDIEVIVVNDHSTDNTTEIVDKKRESNSIIRLLQNEGKGKVQALNYGFESSKGDLIKCIDADDILDTEYFKLLPEIKNVDAHMHDALIVDNDLKKMGTYHMQSAMSLATFQFVFDNLISIPRWSWTFRRQIAENIFPMPDDLPFEDVWFSLHIKSRAKEILHTSKPLYQYRQHEGQTFGGILNYDKPVLNFRANRMLDLISKLRKYGDRLDLENPNQSLIKVENYYKQLSGNFKLTGILNADLDLIQKLKLILICFFPGLAKGVTRVKWKFDSIKSNIRK